jgi:prepilin signal peptidase PulO-like enzyme (type II secretory pathway)
MRDLMPVLSWLLERGKCRHCHKPVGVRYVAIELVTTFASLIAFALIGFRPELAVALVGIVAFISLVTINIERGRDS